MLLSLDGGSPPANLQTVGGLYSQLAGVLAGFAFAGLIALIAAQFTAGGSASYALRSLVPLTAGFIALVGSSLNYGVMAGEPNDLARTTVLETVGGLGFAVAGLMLFYSIAVLLYGVKEDIASTATSAAASPHALTVTKSSIRFKRIFVVLGVGPALMFLLYGGVHDQEMTKTGADTALGWLDYTAMGLAVLLFLFGVVWLSTKRHYTPPPAPAPSPWGPSIIATMAVIIVMTTVVAVTAVVLFAQADTVGPDAVRLSELLLYEGSASR